MRRWHFIGVFGRGVLLLGIALAILIPQNHTICLQDCMEMGCTCHDEKPACCPMAEKEPPPECACDKCGEVQLPDRCYTIAISPEIKRYGETDVSERQVTSSLLDNQYLGTNSISPLDLENRFLSQIDDLISTTVMIC